MVRLRGIAFAILALSVFQWTVLSANAGSNSPTAVIDGFHRILIDVMKNAKDLGVTGRYDRLSTPIKKTFHMPLMIRIASGSYWNRAGQQQRSKLLAAFTRMSVGVYASRFDSYSGQAFETVEEKPGPQKTTLVKTLIASPGDSPVELTYVMKQFKNDWKIVDVLAGGISELAVRRSEYRNVLKTRGVDGLAAVLDKKADGLVGR